MTATVIDFQRFRTARAQGSSPQAIPCSAPVAAEPAPLPEPEQEREMHVPAYCDPANLRVGSKFKRGQSTVEIAKLVRVDIREAIKSGALPRIKVSVTTDSFSGGSSLTVRVREVPPGFKRWTRAYVIANCNRTNYYDTPITAEADALIKALESIVSQYHRDNSDSASDYWDVNFYKHVDFDSSVGRAEWDAIAAEWKLERARENGK